MLKRHSTTIADAAIGSLPAELRSEAQALAWDLFQNHAFDWYDAILEAVAIIREIMDFADEWDRTALPPEPVVVQPYLVPRPQLKLLPPGAARATHKAAYMATVHQIEAVWVPRGWLVPSATRRGIIYRVDDDGTCSCPAGQARHLCWHVALVRRHHAA